MIIKKALFYAADSPIHGKGVFARRHIRAGEIIGVINGVPTSVNGDHVLWLSESRGIHVQCGLRFTNHSDEPNAAWFETMHRTLPSLGSNLVDSETRLNSTADKIASQVVNDEAIQAR